MSVSILKFVMSRRIGSETQKSILMRMAWAAHDDGSNCFVSKARMVLETEIPRSTFYQEIRQLEENGLIVRVGKVGGRINYSLNLHAIESLPVTYEKQGAKVSWVGAQGIKGEREVQQTDQEGPAAGRNTSSHRTQMKRNTKNDKWRVGKVSGQKATSRCHTDAGQNVKYLEQVAKKISEGGYVAPSAITTSQASMMLHLDLVTREQLRSAGIAS